MDTQTSNDLRTRSGHYIQYMLCWTCQPNRIMYSHVSLCMSHCIAMSGCMLTCLCCRQAGIYAFDGERKKRIHCRFNKLKFGGISNNQLLAPLFASNAASTYYRRTYTRTSMVNAMGGGMGPFVASAAALKPLGNRIISIIARLRPARAGRYVREGGGCVNDTHTHTESSAAHTHTLTAEAYANLIRSIRCSSAAARSDDRRPL